MDNALDYIRWRGDLDFDTAPLNEVDLFLFTQLSMPDYDGILSMEESADIRTVADRYFEHHDLNVRNLGVLQSESVLPTLKEMSRAPRFQNLRMKEYIAKTQTAKDEQFAAFTVEDPERFSCIVFRGTDDTIIGWKEDFELAAKETVYAQLDAARYLKKAAAHSPAPKIYVCGHSKGGNLAIYSAVALPEEQRSRISMAISFDGPGFREEFFQKEEYRIMEKKLVSVVSENSIVGLLLKHAGKRYIVHTETKGLWAHDGFSWEVNRCRFAKRTRLSKSSTRINEVMDETMCGMNEKERMALIEELFGTLLAPGSSTLTELSEQSLRTKANLILGLTKDKRVVAFVKAIAGSLLLPKNLSAGNLKENHIPAQNRLPEGTERKNIPEEGN